MPPIFVTATGTGVGKTFLACALVRALRATGRPVQALKPVASGIDPDAPQGSDTALLLEALGQPLTSDAMDAISPWRFRAPLAPNMAARREGRSLDFDEVVAFCRRALAEAGAETWTVIEGVGGVMAPVDDGNTVLDWMAALEPRAVVLVAGSYVGTISHTLTALEILRARGLGPAAVVVSESGTDDEPPLTETLDALARLVPDTTMVALPRIGAGEVPDHLAIWRVLELLGASQVGPDPSLVIPGRCEAASPEPRNTGVEEESARILESPTTMFLGSGFSPSASPGMTSEAVQDAGLRIIWQAGPNEAAPDPEAVPLPPVWRFFLFGDGSATRSLSLLTGERIRVDVVEMRNVDAGEHGPADLAQVAAPRLRRRVWLRTESGVRLGHATSWWNAARARDLLTDPALPIGANLDRRRCAPHRDIRSVFVVRDPDLEAAFGRPAPFWGRNYLMREGGETLCLIREVFSPVLERQLGPLDASASG